MQETQFELWVPVNHARQLQHWTAATDALDHVILTAAALESVLEGMCYQKQESLPTPSIHMLLIMQLLGSRV